MSVKHEKDLYLSRICVFHDADTVLAPSKPTVHLLFNNTIKDFDLGILKMPKLKFLRNKDNNDEKSLKVSVPLDHKNHPPPPPPGAPLNGQMRDTNWMNSVSSLGFK